MYCTVLYCMKVVIVFVQWPIVFLRFLPRGGYAMLKEDDESCVDAIGPREIHTLLYYIRMCICILVYVPTT